ncbi:class I SAM-dependent methyltransferase [Candidatus Berkelbacteria bacterium]|nr:class I SAM-dependent methyltransferase [Candidatus Berkelbacteria bacterium]
MPVSQTETVLTPEELQTIETYNQHARAWADQHNTADYWQTEFDQFQELLPKGRVVEFGAAHGRDAAQLAARGYDYLGTDVATELLAVAAERLPALEFRTMSLYELELPDQAFDGFWASAVLLHIPRSKLAQALREMHRVLRPGGIGFLSVKQGVGEEMVTDPDLAGGSGPRYFVYYQGEALTTELQQAGFRVRLQYVKSVSNKTHWLVYFVERAD